jgi:catecholate siderophore receptor
VLQRHRAGVRASVKPALSLAAVAGIAGLGFTPAHAADAADAAEAATEVTAVEVIAPMRAEPDSPKYTAPLVEMPQTITVVPREVIEAQNLMSLRDVLSTLPGITFGAGEGGGGYGDSINLRGYSASSDLTVDGVRDSAQYTRSDPFNLEQIEVVNGANSAYAGAGSAGGSINMVSKGPRGRDASEISVGAGSDKYGRVTLDANKLLAEGVAVRLNAMAHSNDVPGRDVEKMRRWGVAPAITFGLMGDTRLTLAYFHQTDDNTPQYGVPYGSNSIVNGPLLGVDPRTYYGYRNIDAQESDVDAATVTFDHDFSDRLSVRNLSRWQTVGQHLVVDPPQGAWCLASGINAQTGAACATPSMFAPSGPRGNYRDTDNTLAYNQTDLRASFGRRSTPDR